MKPSRYSTAYRCFLELLREARLQAGLTQVELAELLALPQSYVSKCEGGERRLDVLEARAWILALGGSPSAFMEALDEALAGVNALEGARPNRTLRRATPPAPSKRKTSGASRSSPGSKDG